MPKLNDFQSLNFELLELVDMEKVKIHCMSIDKPRAIGRYPDSCSAYGIKEIFDDGCEYILRTDTYFTKHYNTLNMEWEGDCSCNGFQTHSSARYNANDQYPFNLELDDNDTHFIETGVPSVARFC